MKRAVISIQAVMTLALAGCGQPPGAATATPTPEMKDGHPVVHLPPVETRPFEDGYNAGYDYARQHATRKSKVPNDEEAAEIARQQAAGQPDRWERGFAEGYADGVRNVVTGQK